VNPRIASECWKAHDEDERWDDEGFDANVLGPGPRLFW
jgi:hypothetical protein